LTACFFAVPPFPGYEERVVPRTIRKEQDAKLRELSERTGRSLSELVREAVEHFRLGI